MTYPAFPALPSGAQLDSKKFQLLLTDNTVRKDVEGGYSVTRPRTTRSNRRSFRCAYTMISEVDRATIDTFYQSVYGGASIFTWVSPQDSLTYNVRFKSTVQFNYVGRGTSQFWDCTFDLEQA